jgi:hypothetical protein
MTERPFCSGGVWRNFAWPGETSLFDSSDRGMMVGLNHLGELVRASDCYPMIGVFSCHDSTFGTYYDQIEVGVTWFRTPFFDGGLVVGQSVYAREGRLVCHGTSRVGVLLSCVPGSAEVLVC